MSPREVIYFHLIVSDPSFLERGSAILYNPNSPKEFTLIHRITPKAEVLESDLNEISTKLKENILTQLHNESEIVVINPLEAKELRLKGEPHYIKEHDSPIDRATMLSFLKEVTTTDHSVFQEIITSSLEEVRTYFDPVNRQPDKHSYKQMESVYFEFLKEQQESLKIVYESLQQELNLFGEEATYIHDEL